MLKPIEEYEVENYIEFEKRYLGFGKEIYLKIKEEIPEVFRQLTFYKRLTLQTKDSYAQYSGDNYSFAIQLDPLGEVIVLWNDKKHIEIGTWSENEYNDAIHFITSELIK